MQRLLLALISMLMIVPFSSAWAQNIENSPIDRLRQVSSGVFRGARPNLDGLKFLASIGVKTILYIDNDPDQMAWEIEEANKLGIKVIPTPMSGFWKPKTKQINETLAIMQDPSNYPLFLHCQHGRDRTGLLAGLFRVEFQGWDPEDAYNEMLETGFRRELFLLDYFYMKRTGYQPPVAQDPGYPGSPTYPIFQF